MQKNLIITQDLIYMAPPPSAPPYYIVLILQFEHYIYLTFKKLHSYHVFWRLTSFLNVKPKIIDFWLFGEIFKSMAWAPEAKKCKESHVDAHESL